MSSSDSDDIPLFDLAKKATASNDNSKKLMLMI